MPSSFSRKGNKMDKIIDDLYEAQADKGGFQSLDRVITEEANERLKKYQTKLPQADYEQIRDAVFSVSAIARKQAFETGFKAAVNLILECRGL